ncbi:MAG: enoyl-CoA hydratase/isomerase family protein [Deltaproteobacteria bacterium]|nr:enoyl-CoA hydratase/isomerase family protein [Deltaproteobacteria bacterium]
MTEKNIILEKKGYISILTIDHPPANAINLATAQEFEQALDKVENDPGTRIVIITGGGEKCFSAGFDVSDAANVNATNPLVCKLWTRVDRFTKPTIAAINGFALGGGCELAMACHFRIMVDQPKAKIGLTELNLGLIPGWGGTQRMSRLIGKAKALDMLLFSKKINAPEALEIGLINQVSTPAKLMEDALELADRLSERPPIAVSRILKAMSAGVYEGIDAGLKVEFESAQTLAGTEDAREGLTAFLEKRPPSFRGK